MPIRISMAKSIPLFFILLGLLLSVSYAGGEKTKGKRDGGLMRLITKRTGAKRTDGTAAMHFLLTKKVALSFLKPGAKKRRFPRGIKEECREGCTQEEKAETMRQLAEECREGCSNEEVREAFS